MREKGEEPVMFRYAFNVNDLFLLVFQNLHFIYFMLFADHMIVYLTDIYVSWHNFGMHLCWLSSPKLMTCCIVLLCLLSVMFLAYFWQSLTYAAETSNSRRRRTGQTSKA